MKMSHFPRSMWSDDVGRSMGEEFPFEPYNTRVTAASVPGPSNIHLKKLTLFTSIPVPVLNFTVYEAGNK